MAAGVRRHLAKGPKSMGENALHLDDLIRGMSGLTPHEGGSLAEAAAVCLESQGHLPGAELQVVGLARTRLPVYWPRVVEQVRRTYADANAATERGACAIAMLVVRRVMDLEVIERSAGGNGFDYWVAPREGQGKSAFSGRARLEVSGIRLGTMAQVRSRRRAKERQTLRAGARGASIVAIVEFSRPLAMVTKP